MADDLDSRESADSPGGRERKISKKALKKLKNETIVKFFLRPDQERRKRSWWAKILLALTKRRWDGDD